jgi:hypothetical protein
MSASKVDRGLPGDYPFGRPGHPAELLDGACHCSPRAAPRTVAAAHGLCDQQAVDDIGDGVLAEVDDKQRLTMSATSIVS